MDNIVDWLQNWTMSQIDGDWEHELGVSIGMLIIALLFMFLR